MLVAIKIVFVAELKIATCNNFFQSQSFSLQNYELKAASRRVRITVSSKTAGYHRYNLRIAIFVKKALKKMKTYFLRKNTPSS